MWCEVVSSVVVFVVSVVCGVCGHVRLVWQRGCGCMHSVVSV